MKRNFWTGLVMLLPFFLTFLIITTILGFINSPFLFFTDQILSDLFSGFINRHLIHIASHFMIAAYLLGLILLVGYIADNLLTVAIVEYSDRFLRRIPIIRTIYGSASDLTKNVFSGRKESFKKVVLVPYPHARARAIGFVTSEYLDSEKVSVFVSGAPNLSVGFMLNYKKEEVEFLDLSVTEAFKIIVSCGVTQNEQQ